MAVQLLSPVTWPETSGVILDPSPLLTAIFDGCWFSTSLIYLRFIPFSLFALSLLSLQQHHLWQVSLVHDCISQGSTRGLEPLGVFPRRWLMQLCTPPCCGGWINSPSKAVSVSDARAWSPQGRCSGRKDWCEVGGWRAGWNPQAWVGTPCPFFCLWPRWGGCPAEAGSFIVVTWNDLYENQVFKTLLWLQCFEKAVQIIQHRGPWGPCLPTSLAW